MSASAKTTNYMSKFPFNTVCGDSPKFSLEIAPGCTSCKTPMLDCTGFCGICSNHFPTISSWKSTKATRLNHAEHVADIYPNIQENQPTTSPLKKKTHRKPKQNEISEPIGLFGHPISDLDSSIATSKTPTATSKPNSKQPDKCTENQNSNDCLLP